MNWIVSKEKPFSLDDYLARTELDRIALKSAEFKAVRKRSWDWTVQRDYWEVEHRRVKKVLSHVIAARARPDLVAWARDRLEFLIRENPDVLPAVYRTLGVAYGELAKQDDTLVEKQVEAWNQYIHMDRGRFSDPAFKEIRKFVEDHRSN